MPVDQSLVLTILYARELTGDERAAVEHAMTSRGMTHVSWTDVPTGRRTFGRFSCPPSAGRSPDLSAAGDARSIGRPGGVQLAIDVTPSDPAHLRGLFDAFGGAGKPAGALDCWQSEVSVGIVWDGGVTPVGLLLDLIDVETRGRRTIVPILPLDDAALAAVASVVLRLPDLGPETFIETHLDRLARC